jgi:hypothetical protein
MFITWNEQLDLEQAVGDTNGKKFESSLRYRILRGSRETERN